MTETGIPCKACGQRFSLLDMHRGSNYQKCSECTRREWREAGRAQYAKRKAAGIALRTPARRTPYDIVAPGRVETLAPSLPSLGNRIGRSLESLDADGVDPETVAVTVEREGSAWVAVLCWQAAS